MAVLGHYPLRRSLDRHSSGYIRVSPSKIRAVSEAVKTVPQLPFFSSASGFTKSALGGWEASGVMILQSGAPFTIFDPAGGTAYSLASPSTTATFSSGFGCANAPSAGSIRSRLANWVNPLAYESNPHATLSDGSMSDATLYGNTPRNCIIGPPQKNVDLNSRQDV